MEQLNIVKMARLAGRHPRRRSIFRRLSVKIRLVRLGAFCYSPPRLSSDLRCDTPQNGRKYVVSRGSPWQQISGLRLGSWYIRPLDR